MPLRFLLVLVLIVVLLRFLGRLARVVLEAMVGASGPPVRAGARAGTPSIALVRCRRCGVFVPQDKARGSGDATLCSDCAGR
jgi:hypothetical protein